MPPSRLRTSVQPRCSRNIVADDERLPEWHCITRGRSFGSSAWRSAAATGFLLRSGWTDVVNVEGGTTAWAKAGLPVRRGEVAPGEGEL